ncbi:uncharacterized protein LOC135486693 isoform X2 [Lineus longissimus]|uniref:uncharacterized protein LOC135486693 isoform X2 n=1 Tax=Lineus longissimus TaxID=88925 RepID=UPI00315DA630
MMKLPTFFLLAFVVSFGKGVESELQSIGWGKLTPSDPFLEVGQPFRLNCTMFCNRFDENVSCNVSNVFIKFIQRGNKADQSVLVRNDGNVRLTPLSSTIMEYYNPSVQMSDMGKYHCYIRRSESDLTKSIWLDSTRVSIGYPPKIPTRLDCRSPNWDSMKCSWDCSRYDKFGPTKVYWNVTYILDYISTNLTSPEGDFDSCSFEINNDFHKAADYSFTLTAYSLLRTVTGKIHVKASRALVVPGQVRDLDVVEATNSSLTLQWVNPKNLEPKFLPLIYQVQGMSRYKILNTMYVVEKCRTCKLVVKDLVPYTGYTFRVRSKPEENGLFWSNYTFVSAMTDTYIPGRNPETTTGGFTWETRTARDGTKITTAVLYYQDIPPQYAHGAISDVEASFQKKESGYSFHSFTEACNHQRRECYLNNLLPDQDYSITIEAKTMMGYGPIVPTSVFHILPVQEGPAPPEDFHAEIYQTTSNDTANTTSIYFTWDNSTVSPNATYTLFYRYCNNVNCTGGLQWEKFDAATDNYNLTIINDELSISDYSFSMAVSIGLFSQGMLDWVTCLYDYNKPLLNAPELEIMEPEVQEEKSLKVKWESMPCTKNGMVIHYDIIVMELTDDNQPTGKNVTHFVSAKETSFTIPNLKLGTQYGITLIAVGRSSSKQSQQLIGATIQTPENPITMIIIGIVVAVTVLVIIFVIFCSCRYYRKLVDTPISINVPRGNGLIASFDYRHEDVEEFVIDAEGEEAENSDSENSPILSPVKKTTLDTHRQLSRDSGTGSMVSNTTKDSFNLSEAGTDSVNNSLEAVSEEGEDQYHGSGCSRRSADDSRDLMVTQLPTSQGYCVVGLANPDVPDVLRDIQAYGPGPPQNNVFTVGLVQFENPNLPRSLAHSEESVDFKPVHSSSRGTSTNSLETLTTPSPLPAIRQLQRNYLPDLGYGTDDSEGKAKAKQQAEIAKKEAERRKLKDNPLKKNKDFSSLGSVCSSSSFEESYSKLAVRNIPQDDSALNNNVVMDDKNIHKAGSLSEFRGKVMAAVLPVKTLVMGDVDAGKGTRQKKAFDDSCGNSLADTNSDSNLSLGSDPKTSPSLPDASVELKNEPRPVQILTGGYVQRPDTLVGRDVNGGVVNLRDTFGGDVSEDDTCSDSISPYSKLGISPDMVDLSALGPHGNYMPRKDIQPMAGKNGYVDLPILNNALPGQRDSIRDDLSDSSSQSDFSVEDCSIDLKALGLNMGGAAVLPLDLDTGLSHTDLTNNTLCNGYIRDSDINKTTCV